MRKIKFLVTGGAGRLGSEIVKIFSFHGFETITFDLPGAYWEAIRGVEGTNIFFGDITDLKSTLKACRDVNAVIHLAALLPPQSEASWQLTMRVNVKGTKNLLEILKMRNDTPLIFASSISTYGVTAAKKPPIIESHLLYPHNYYAKSKIEAEHLVRSSGVPYVILRIAPIAVPELFELPEKIPYRADQRVEFVYLVDAAQALFESSMNPEALGEVLNIAGGPSWQMTGTEYITRFYDALGICVEPVFSEDYTALDWYDTSRSRFLGYQRTTFNAFLERLRVLGNQLGFR